MRVKFALVLTVAVLLALSGVALAQRGNSFANADFVAELSGDNEVPPVNTDATGEARFIRDGDVLHFELEIDDATDILGAAGAHIHCGAVGVNGPIAAFLAGAVPANGFDGTVEVKATLDDDSVMSTDCGDDLAELINSIEAGNTYVNAHSPANPGGEIRGQIEVVDS